MLKSKADAKVAFQKYIAQAENEVGRNLIAMRTDRGGEFLSREFADICDPRGIKRYFTAPY